MFAPAGFYTNTKEPEIVDLTGAGFEQIEHPAKRVLRGVESHLLGDQLTSQLGFIQNTEFIIHDLNQQKLQSVGNGLLLKIGVTVPVDNLMAETLTTAADAIANAGRTHANTRRLYLWPNHSNNRYFTSSISPNTLASIQPRFLSPFTGTISSLPIKCSRLRPPSLSQ